MQFARRCNRGAQVAGPFGASALLQRNRWSHAIRLAQAPRSHATRTKLPLHVAGQMLGKARTRFSEQSIKDQRALAAPRHASHYRETIARDIDIDILEVVRCRATQAHGSRRRRP